ILWVSVCIPNINRLHKSFASKTVFYNLTQPSKFFICHLLYGPSRLIYPVKSFMLPEQKCCFQITLFDYHHSSSSRTICPLRNCVGFRRSGAPFDTSRDKRIATAIFLPPSLHRQ